VISLPGYTEREKLIIAKRYLVPKQMKENGLKRSLLRFGDKALEKLIRDYTREAGVRNLEREIASVSRKVAKRLAEGKKNKVMITPQNLHSFLGPLKFMPETAIATDIPGVACGLAWTETGGELLFVEASCRKGRRELTLTGSMGDVMKESAQAALTYIKAKAKQLNIPQESFDELEMHIHVPQGAIPKDGPSAGVTMAVAMISALTQKVIASKIAMTGEITLTGRVLPIGGLKEKTLAALRAGLKKVIIPEENLKDLEDIPDYVKRKVTFLPVKDMDDVIKLLFSAPSPKRRPLPGKRIHRERSLLLRQR
jgi:ATP-dependent Lon protease